MSTTAPLSQTDIDLLRTLQDMREWIVSENFTDGPEKIAALDTIISRLRRGRRQNRPCGQLKALVAATPPGGVLQALDNSHAACLRAVARAMKRHARVARVTPGKPTRTVTLLD